MNYLDFELEIAPVFPAQVYLAGEITPLPPGELPPFNRVRSVDVFIRPGEVVNGAIPEPSTLAIWSLLGLTVGVCRWRRR